MFMAFSFSIIVIIYSIITRLSTIIPILPFAIVISLFYGSLEELPGSILTLPNSHVYRILCLIYLTLDGIHQMLLGFRTRSFDNLVADPLFPTRLIPGTIVCTDKKFSLIHAIWGLLLGASKGIISIQALSLGLPFVFQSIFWAGFILSILVVISETIMLAVIHHNQESRFLSVEMGMRLEGAPQKEPSCCMARYLFRVPETINY